METTLRTYIPTTFESGYKRLGTEVTSKPSRPLHGQDHRSVAIPGLGTQLTKVDNWRFVPVETPSFIETTTMTAATGSMPTRLMQDTRQVRFWTPEKFRNCLRLDNYDIIFTFIHHSFEEGS